MKKPVSKKKPSNGKAPAVPLKLNMGCGLLKRDGYVGCDVYKTPVTDKVFDATKAPWPFKDGSVETIFMSHFFEHFNGRERVEIMKEAYRVLKLGGTIELISPHWSSMRSIQDPTHKWPPLGESSFLYFNQQWCRMNGVAHTGSEDGVYNFDFNYGHNTSAEWQNKNAETRGFAVAHYLNVAEDLQVQLKKVELLPPMPKQKYRRIHESGRISEFEE